MRARRFLVVVAVVVVAGSCTTTTTTTTASPTAASPPTSSSIPPPTGATLGDGTALPSHCAGKAVPNETVAFVADGRAWALDPHEGGLACLFRVEKK